MIRISNIKVSPKDELTLRKVAKAVGVGEDEIKSFHIYKKSVDARKKNDVHYVYTLDVLLKDEKKAKYGEKVTEKKYKFTRGADKKYPPLVVGSGPAGLMCALVLSEAGYKPLLIEQGDDVDTRKAKVEDFWKNGILDTRTNVQFGEGGAGTFSDGKLNTGIKDVRCRFVLEQFVRFGAPEEILYEAKPHIGTDYLCKTVKNIRKRIIECGGEVRFKNRLEKVLIKDSKVIGAVISGHEKGEYTYKTEDIVLCIGHSAFETFKMLYDENIDMCKKAFSVGVRIEHKQEMINKSQYGDFYEYLENADYKLSYHLPNGRGVYTFCMCPGGYVVNSASEEGSIVTNGMSYSKRDGENANSAVLVSVLPEDIEGENPLSGFYFQKKIEKKAYELGGGYFAPCQRVGDFLKNADSVDCAEIKPTIKPGVKYCRIDDIFPRFVTESLKEALPEFDKKLKGFADPDALLTAPETRSSSPVRIMRDSQSLQSVSVKGLYPCGEGAGYAGGIMSAAADGIKCAEALVKN